MLLATLMVLLPWSAYSGVNELDSEQEAREVSQAAWGASGSNDTGWIDLVATGADPDNGSYAYSDLFLPFAPGAQISNLTFEIAVNGSADITQMSRRLLSWIPKLLFWIGEVMETWVSRMRWKIILRAFLTVL